MEEGTKYDGGKPRIGEMLQDFALPLLEVTKAWEYGASKYEKRNWRKVENGKDRYTNALLRHLLAEEERLVDDESLLLHATHVAWNALARLWFILQEPKTSEHTTVNIPKEAFNVEGLNDALHHPVREYINDFFDSNKYLYLDKDINTTNSGGINIIE